MLPPLGARIDYAGHHGSIRYVGQVLNSQGLWLGVDWDDGSRGKHSGAKDGVQYFQCLVPGSGSFIRPSAKVSLGTSFLHALSSKYIESLHGSESQEIVILGSSNGSIQVEAVDLDKIRRKLSDLGRLREVSLDKENVSCSDPPGTILKSCPHIRGLDLSNSLIPSWDVVAEIASELPALERLALNRNRLSLPTRMDLMTSAFPNLIELQLNRTMTSWSIMMTVTSMMPRVQIIGMGYNQLSHLHTGDNRVGTSIQSVNLDGNLCSDWSHLSDCFELYPSLQRIVLSSNGLASIPFPGKPTLQLAGIRHLALSFNHLKSWNDIDALAAWCPNLESLMLGGNPLAVESEKLLRPFTVAKIASLRTLDGSTISPKEREDCELFYLSRVSQGTSKSLEELAHEHPRWQELRSKHGQTEDNRSNNATHGRLKDHVITLNIFLANGGVDKTFPFETSEHITLRVMPSMTLRMLRTKISRVLKGRGRAQVMLWQRMRDDALAELDYSRDAEDLSWVGLQDGGFMVCAFQDE